MTHRILAAGIAILAFGSVFAPLETSASSRSVFAARPHLVRGADRPSVAPPIAHRTPPAQGSSAAPIIRHSGPPQERTEVFPTRDLRVSRRQDRRYGGFGYGFAAPYSFPTAYDPSAYAPYEPQSGDAAAYEESAEACRDGDCAGVPALAGPLFTSLISGQAPLPFMMTPNVFMSPCHSQGCSE
jgi:hypothetical protein